MNNPPKHISPIWSRAFSIHVDRGEGAYLYDLDGRQYLDFTSGIGVTNTGHTHPKVVAAVQAQAAKLLHGQANMVYHQPMMNLIEELRTLLPPKLDSFYFSNTGAEIVEGAVKLARWATKRPNVIVFQGGFHGRTNATMAMTTAKTVYRAGYQPLAAGVFVAPFPYVYQYGWDEEETVKFCLKQLKLLLKSQTSPDETAAMVIEPVLGEGGYVPPPAAFMVGLREICDHYGILLIADEVQSGFGRTGEWFGIDHFEVTPDIMVMAKGLASGLPLSGLAAPADMMAKWPPGSHGGTYGGNVVACAAAAATVQVIRDEGLVSNSRQMGEVLQSGLRRLQEDYPAIGDVRGLGLMVGTEFTTSNGEPWAERAKGVIQAAFDEGQLMLLGCGTFDNVVRWIPPLIATEEQIKHALNIFGAALESTEEEFG